MVNPCALKGITLFLALADRNPEVPFLAVTSWGTGAADRAALAQRPNVRTVGPVEDIDEVLCQTRVLVVPSLWDETFGFVCVEAMLRGIPVLAADVGGLAEAKLGVPYLLPVRPIQQYSAYGDQPLPTPIVPDQAARPWQTALQELLTDPAHYQEVADRSRTAAEAFTGALDPAALDTHLRSLTPAPPEPASAQKPEDDQSTRLADALTPARRAALTRLLAARRPAHTGMEDRP